MTIVMSTAVITIIVAPNNPLAPPRERERERERQTDRQTDREKRERDRQRRHVLIKRKTMERKEQIVCKETICDVSCKL